MRLLTSRSLVQTQLGEIILDPQINTSTNVLIDDVLLAPYTTILQLYINYIALPSAREIVAYDLPARIKTAKYCSIRLSSFLRNLQRFAVIRSPIRACHLAPNAVALSLRSQRHVA